MSSDETLVRRPRSNSELVYKHSEKKLTSAVEKDTMTFPLATIDSCISALRGLYGALTRETEIALRNKLKDSL